MSEASQFVWAQASTLTAATSKPTTAVPQPHLRLNQIDGSAAQINQDAIRQLTTKYADGSIRRIEHPEDRGPATAGPHIPLPGQNSPRVDWRDLIQSTVQVGVSQDIELERIVHGIAADDSVAGPENSAAPTTQAADHRSDLGTSFPTTEDDETADRDTPADTLNPAWEVDRFRWPVAVTQLYEEQHEQFEQAGQHLRAATREGLRVLGVTGLQRSEGRTAIALCLAQAAAEAGVQVALVDGDLQHPGTARQLQLRVAADWRQVAGQETTLEEAAILSVEDGWTLFPIMISGAESQPPVISAASMSETITHIAQHYSLVIVDLGPIDLQQPFLRGVHGDCPLDACIVVRDLRHQGLAAIRAAAEHLLQSGVEAVGIAQNFAAE